MRHETQVELLERVLAHVDARTTQLADRDARVPVSNYTSEARLRDEMRVLFRRYPIALGHASELPRAGDFFTSDETGVPILVVRDQGGELRAFLNVCRHRGTRLVTEPRGEHKKAFVCRYHAWAYDLAGSLLHVPLKAAFPSVDCEQSGLVPLPLELRAGMLWVTPGGAPGAPLADFLGPVGDDLDHFSLATHVVHRRSVRRQKSNWKFVIDAFLEGYHVKSLHRDTIYRFFLEQGAVFDAMAPHVRSVGARRTIAEARETPRERWDIRAYGTVFYYLFPNTVLVFHPDWVSKITMYPDGTDRSIYTHSMLIPEAPTSEKAERHWDRTFELIEENVFAREDLDIAESIQSVAHAMADDSYRIGRLEYPIRLFHDAIDRAIAEHPPAP